MSSNESHIPATSAAKMESALHKSQNKHESDAAPSSDRPLSNEKWLCYEKRSTVIMYNLINLVIKSNNEPLFDDQKI